MLAPTNKNGSNPLSLNLNGIFSFFLETECPIGNWGNSQWLGHPQTVPQALVNRTLQNHPSVPGVFSVIQLCTPSYVLEPPDLFTPAYHSKTQSGQICSCKTFTKKEMKILRWHESLMYPTPSHSRQQRCKGQTGALIWFTLNKMLRCWLVLLPPHQITPTWKWGPTILLYIQVKMISEVSHLPSSNAFPSPEIKIL